MSFMFVLEDFRPKYGAADWYLLPFQSDMNMPNWLDSKRIAVEGSLICLNDDVACFYSHLAFKRFNEPLLVCCND